MFERHGLRAVIADPGALEWRDGMLWHGDLAIDLVYNRLTDFYLEQASSAALREAYLQQAVVLTPHPQAHALYADKRHLALFSDATRLEELGVPREHSKSCWSMPRTELVDAADAQRLWDARRGLFFKPVAGFGSRAAYRGDKLTKRVWQDILASDYVAQAIVAPGERMASDQQAVTAVNTAKAMKFDLRVHARRVRSVGGRAPVPGADHQLPHAGGWLRAGVQLGRLFGANQACADDSDAETTASPPYVVFLLDDGGGSPCGAACVNVALARGEASAPTLAGQSCGWPTGMCG